MRFLSDQKGRPSTKINHGKVSQTIWWFLGACLILFALYLIVSRDPPYFTSAKAKDVVIGIGENHNGWGSTLRPGSGRQIELVATYIVNNIKYIFDNPNVNYYNSGLHVGNTVTIVYATENPQHATLVKPIGYWITTQEIFYSFLFCSLAIWTIKKYYKPIREETLVNKEL